jgi:hypothetical protein
MVDDAGANALEVLTLIRIVLLGALAVGTAGTIAELLLLGHFDGWKQVLPLILLGVMLLVIVWHGFAAGAASVHALRILAVVFLASGALGVYYHYRGNVEFELEMYPDTAGWALFKKAMTGATPALAPGAMAELGLIGIAYTIGHPRLRRSRDSGA